MKERPIIFSAPMVRALLDGTKTQTRRVVKPEGAHHLFQFRGTTAAAGADEPTGEWGWCGSSNVVNKHIRCPYGKPGDRLWVRETHSIGPGHGVHLEPSESAGALRFPHVTYAADGAVERREERWSGAFATSRPSIHMPRWASRITLEVTGVRVERLQDISETDAQSEGCDGLHWDGIEGKAADLIDWPLKSSTRPFANDYAVLWESINGPGSWDENPWVWVIEFERIES